jgi:hypothetical protein
MGANQSNVDQRVIAQGNKLGLASCVIAFAAVKIFVFIPV